MVTEYSLRRRLIATTVGSSVAVGLASTAIVLAVAWRDVGNAFDDTLKEGSRIVLALGESALRGGSAPAGAGKHRPQELKLDYQIVADNGTVLLRGDDAPNQPFVAPAELRKQSFHDVYADGHWWRVHVRNHPAQGFTVQVGQEWEERTELLEDVLQSLAWPLVALWALLGISNWWLIRRQLTPLTRMAQSMESKSPDDLAPFAQESQAREVRSVTSALNHLLERLSHAREGERRFTADAAHELRTPLAALASRIQLMQRSHGAQSPQLAADLQRLREDVTRNTALVENLLQLARLDPQSADAAALQPVDLPALLAEAVQACATAAEARKVRVTIHANASSALGHRDWLFSALRNLVDNAIRYGRVGGQVQVSATQRGAMVELAVRDDGPGVDSHEREQLTRRFYRVLGTSTPGNGLGLSIVERIAELHGAVLRLGPGLEGCGLGVSLELAAASDSLHVPAVQ